MTEDALLAVATAETETIPLWIPPTFPLSSPPSAASSITVNEAAGTFNASTRQSNFFRAARWCPDGSCALTSSEDRSFQIISLPKEISNQSTTNDWTMKVNAPLRQPAPMFDFLWYPYASSMNSAAFCFVASVRECPVKLLDANDGRLRASYRIFDHRERFVAPHSLAFDGTATKLYCGFQDAIEEFDLSRPGDGTRLHTTPSKKSRDGMKGIISSIAFSPDYASNTFLASTLSSSSNGIALFSTDTGGAPQQFLGGVERGGVTQVQFNPARPHIVYAASRRSSVIQSWDLRNPDCVMQEYDRGGAGTTNQRLRFDLDFSGKVLGFGNQDGEVSLYDISGEEATATLRFQGHNDGVGSVAFHPIHPLLMTVSGSRHFLELDPTSSESSEAESQLDSGEDEQPATLSRARDPVARDPSLKLWSFGKDSGAITSGT
ncbi:hypothetical protein BOTBODRAFT_134321 [Botryobasidium botryosum FD-172 SS1]|uniref:Uncharacterized protein n=1 Tax=Botryobasidium botryosum (strain FD-172 SS1) TaxID=930990 RepID=A0A067MAI5_BOTB1|nr:hypothetical protein BOTBODRAFT_134321 [Botryobasidium botryosum FD-172 SS1]